MKNKIYVRKKEIMEIKQYKVRVLNEDLKYPILVYATDVIIRDGIVLFYIDAEIQFACTVNVAIFKLCPDKKNPVTKASAILSNTLINI